MKTLNIKKHLAIGLTVAGAAFTSNLHADTQLLLSGGSASSGVIFERATNLFGGVYTVYTNNNPTTLSSTTRTYFGTIPGHTELGSVTLAINLYVGAVGALNDISAGTPEPVVTGGGISGSSFTPTVVDSSATPGVIGVDPSQFVELPTYIVPYVFIKNTSASSSTAGITNLTQNQAQALESSGATIPASFFGGNSTNVIYFVGRNRDSAVRTEIDLNINTLGFQTYTTNGLGQIVQDTTSVDLEGNIDPGQSSGSAEAGVVAYITNSIGEVAFQNVAAGTAALAYNGVVYSTNSVIDGTYALWNPENYYYKPTAITANQLAVLNLYYSSITNSSYWSNSQFKGKFIPTPWVNANVTRSGDGGPIKPKPGYTVY